MSWAIWALLGAGMWALAWLASRFPLERRKWRSAQALIASVRSDEKPRRIPLGDYVPDEWIAEWERKNRHPDDCKCRACAQRYPRPGGAL